MQLAQYQESEGYDRVYRDKNVQLSYMSKQKFRIEYPEYEGGYKIMGAIGKGVRNQKGELQVKEKTIPYYALQFQKFAYDIDGYIEVDKDVYIAVLKNKRANIIYALALLTLISCAAFYIMNQDNVPIDSLAGKYTPPAQLPLNTDTSHISIPGYSDIRMEAGTDIAYVSLWNPDGNPCFFIFTISRSDTKEELYQSKLIPPGYAVSEVNLNQKIEKGTLPITISISTYDLIDYKKQLNGGEVQANLLGIEKSEQSE